MGNQNLCLIIVWMSLQFLAISCWAEFLNCDERYGRRNLDKRQVMVHTQYGTVEGFSIPVHNKYLNKRVNVFLGIPYAKRPSDAEHKEYRFRVPDKPEWDGVWDATKQRPACPQSPWYVRETIPNFHEMDEDCLYMNIYAPNTTRQIHSSGNRWGPVNWPLYPVIVFIHGGGFVMGSSQQHPGYFLAERDAVVVTFNYRLNALGFLSTEDRVASGNYGMWDQVYAMHFVRNNIKFFQGNPNRITLAGHDAGAASVGIHMLSPQSYKLFDYAIMMSGSDRNVWAVKEKGSASYYSHRLALNLGCPTNDNNRLIKCLQQRSAMEIVNASAWIQMRPGEVGNPWGPVLDGDVKGFSQSILPQPPKEMREERRFKRIKVLAGIVDDEGAYYIPNYFGLEEGIQPTEFQNLIYEFVLERNVSNYERALDSLEFEYTYYEDPRNITGIRNRSIAMMSDYMFGAGVDEVVKYHARYNDTYFYVFKYKSHYDYLPPWRGVAHGQELQYVFGFPYFSSCYRELSGIYPRQDYSLEDREMSNYMMTAWTNFSLHGTPTPSRDSLKDFRGVYWPPFRWNNQSYMIIDNHTRVGFRYRQQEYLFWSEYFPKVSLQYCRGSASPAVAASTKGNISSFMTATWSLVVVNVILLLLLIAFAMSLCRMYQKKDF
ncbi:hypothetical protein Ahia01_001193600 [Argonauta hians]